MTSSNLIRWAGLSAVAAGVLLAVGGIIHLADDPALLATNSWAIANYLILGSVIFGLLGIFGLYARQVEEAGLLGLVGFLMLFVALVLFAGLAFFEAFFVPVLAAEAPEFLLSEEISFGVLETVIPLGGLLQSIGGLLFGIAVIRAGILPRWAAIVFIIGVVAGGLGPLLPEVAGRITGVVLGIGLSWLGYALWSERREKASEPSPAMQS